MTSYVAEKTIRRSPREHKMPPNALYMKAPKILINKRVARIATRHIHPYIDHRFQKVIVLDCRDSNTRTALIRAGIREEQIIQITNDPATHRDHENSGTRATKLCIDLHEYLLSKDVPMYATAWLDFCDTYTTNEECMAQAVRVACRPGAQIKLIATFSWRKCAAYEIWCREIPGKSLAKLEERRAAFIHYICQTLSMLCSVKVTASWYMFYDRMYVVQFDIQKK